MTIAYAFLDQIDQEQPISKPRRKNTKDPACALYKKRNSRNAYNKVYDDVLDTYLEDDSSPHLDPKPRNIDGFPSGELTQMSRFNDQFDDRSLVPPRRIINPSPPHCNTTPEPLMHASYENSLAYDRFYDEDQMFDGAHNEKHVPQEQRHITQEHVYDEYLTQQEAPSNYNVHEAPYTTTTSSQSQQQWIELVLFILSGVFMIFLMEQILQLGIRFGLQV